MIKGRYYYITEPITNLQKNRLISAMSYVKKNARFLNNPAWGYVNLFNEKLNRFPIGLIQRAKNIIPISTYNLKKVSPEVKYGDLRQYQKEALDKMVENFCGIIKIPTAGGKTRVAVQYIKNFKKSTLVLVPTRYLVKQWEEDVPDYVHVKTYASIKKKEYLQQFKLVIFDECHHVAAKTLFKIGISLNEEAEVYGFSATPLSRDDDNLKVEAVLGPIIYEISSKELIEQGYLSKAKIYYYNVPEDDTEFFDYPTAYNEYILNNEYRNNKIIELIKKSVKPCLVLVNLIEHGDNLIKQLEGYDAIFLNGKSKEYDTNHDVIIATSIFDEGVNLPHLRTLILAGGGKSTIKICQRIGRLLRVFDDKDFAIIYDFKDDCKWLRKHYKERRKIFEKDFEVYDDTE